MVFMYHYHHIMCMSSMRDLSHCIGQPGMMRGMSGYPGALFYLLRPPSLLMIHFHNNHISRAMSSLRSIYC
jgi:hypothetical protein